MTELIVALDGPEPYELAYHLAETANVSWFKIGPQCLADSRSLDYLLDMAGWPLINIFFDLKLADTEDTCREAAKRFAEAGIAAVSTFTDSATDAAARGAEGTPLRVWRVLRLTDGFAPLPRQIRIGDGVICAVRDLQTDVTMSSDIDKICPGVRRVSDTGIVSSHREVWTPQQAIKAGATHIVVGRPIWQAADPVVAAKEFLSLISGFEGGPSARL